MIALSTLLKQYYKASHLPEYLGPIVDLTIRMYLATVFFKSGLTKIQNWDSTLSLFSDVYQVPLLDPTVAAWMATCAELGLPVLLVAGLLGRFAAAGLFILNAVALISYYSELSPAGIHQHWYWGTLLITLLVMRSRCANWAVDTWLEKRLHVV